MEKNFMQFQEEHLNFLTFNQETQEIMKIFPTNFPSDLLLRKEIVILFKKWSKKIINKVADVICKVKEILDMLEEKKRYIS
jgi:hypothetical protein